MRDVLLEPSVLFAPHVRRALAAHPGAVHAAAHVTGGGIAANLARALPDGLRRRRRSLRHRGPGDLRRAPAARADRRRRDGPAFNLGVGMVLVVDPDRAAAVAATIADGGVRPPRWPARCARAPPGDGPVSVDPDTKAALVAHLLEHAVRRGSFTLKSGKPTAWFIDAKQTACRPEAMLLVADAVLSVCPPDATAIGGLTMGADPSPTSPRPWPPPGVGPSRSSACARR